MGCKMLVLDVTVPDSCGVNGLLFYFFLGTNCFPLPSDLAEAKSQILYLTFNSAFIKKQHFPDLQAYKKGDPPMSGYAEFLHLLKDQLVKM